MQATIQYIKTELDGMYPKSEIDSFIRLIFESVCGWDFTAQILNKHLKIDEHDFEKINGITNRLKHFEPIQYILGETYFMGLKLSINSSVLIPRPETEELVQWILSSGVSGEKRVLDIGTGSGCIAISIKKSLPEANVTAIDISEKALEIAGLNSKLNNSEVNFLQADILNWNEIEIGKFDVIVSNPPYVRECEKAEMQRNVLDFEPENALFVPDANPLIFYESISHFAQKNLTQGGNLFFEINENLAFEMKELLQHSGFTDIEFKNDFQGKTRMVKCCK